MASSSAAIVLPIVDSLRADRRDVVDLLPQVAIADSLCIVLLPLVIDTDHVARAALGAVGRAHGGGRALPGSCAAVERSGLRRRVHDVSEDREFAVELRVSLAAMFAMAALAVAVHVSLMLAGFVSGLAVAAVGEPRRVAKQLFAVTEGFFGPLFFVWLGAALQLRDLVRPPVDGRARASASGSAPRSPTWRPSLLRQPAPYAMLASAQLGVPVAAATIGGQLDLLEPGEGAALVLGALIALAVTVAGGSLAGAVRRTPTATRTAARLVTREQVACDRVIRTPRATGSGSLPVVGVAG